ncbi:MAG: toll/interleukin-1 receptor domain-containing protein [Hyphomonadaceae bacterium]
MADVFLSYAREDTARAEQVANGLSAAGLDVFWDNEIPPGTTWADYIEGKLNQCKALIVLWSEHSTKSQWVREEARMGRDKGVLIPVMIDSSQPPFGFGEVQAANLANWNGEADNPNWRRFIDAVMRTTKVEPRPAPPPVAQPATVKSPPAVQPSQQPTAAASLAEPKKKSGLPVWVWVVGAVVATVVVLGIIGSMMPEAPQQQQTAQSSTQLPAANQAPTGDQNPTQTNANQIQQITAALAQQGFQMAGQPVTANMPQGQYSNVPVQMNVGYEYRVVGVCDADCGNLDIIIYDGYNNAIGHDTLADSQPVVGILPTSSGMFTAQVQMISCTVAPCYFTVAAYARPAR